jgi:hypothetical protein
LDSPGLTRISNLYSDPRSWSLDSRSTRPPEKLISCSGLLAAFGDISLLTGDSGSFAHSPVFWQTVWKFQIQISEWVDERIQHRASGIDWKIVQLASPGCGCIVP